MFLAFAANDLADARQRLKNDLCSAGLTVVPADDAPPDTAAESVEVIGKALGQAECAVHFLGGKRGFTPEGGQEPLLDLQLRLARDAAAASGRAQVLWSPRWLPRSAAAGKRDPFAVIDGFGGRREGEDVFGEEVTVLSQWLRKSLEPAPAPAPAAQPEALLIVASAAEGDDDLAFELANLAQGHGARVQPWPSDEASTVLIPWGSASREAFEALLARLGAGSPIVCLRLPGGDEAAKKRFFRDGGCQKTCRVELGRF